MSLRIVGGEKQREANNNKLRRKEASGVCGGAPAQPGRHPTFGGATAFSIPALCRFSPPVFLTLLEQMAVSVTRNVLEIKETLSTLKPIDKSGYYVQPCMEGTRTSSRRLTHGWRTSTRPIFSG
jgi:hypothetical protein